MCRGSFQSERYLLFKPRDTWTPRTEWHECDAKWLEGLDRVETICTFLFTLEMLLKAIALNPIEYLRPSLNRLDAFMVLVFWLQEFPLNTAAIALLQVMGARMRLCAHAVMAEQLQGFRVLQPLRVLNRIPVLKFAFYTLEQSFLPLTNCVFILFATILIFSILGMNIFMGDLRHQCFKPREGAVSFGCQLSRPVDDMPVPSCSKPHCLPASRRCSSSKR